MSSSYSVSADWTLSTALMSPAERRVECLPAEPLSEQQLVGLLEAEAVMEVWLPLWQPHSSDASDGDSNRLIRDIWIEFANRLHAVRYEHPGGMCPVAWYRALHPIKTGNGAIMVEDPLAQYTRLSRRPAVNGG